jgi:glycolate oxidase iron-sulfur subunit
VAASGNIGCMTQLSDSIGIPFVHTVELLDWATGGPEPDSLRAVKARPKDRDTARGRVTA